MRRVWHCPNASRARAACGSSLDALPGRELGTLQYNGGRQASRSFCVAATRIREATGSGAACSASGGPRSTRLSPHSFPEGLYAILDVLSPRDPHLHAVRAASPHRAFPPPLQGPARPAFGLQRLSSGQVPDPAGPAPTLGPAARHETHPQDPQSGAHPVDRGCSGLPVRRCQPTRRPVAASDRDGPSGVVPPQGADNHHPHAERGGRLRGWRSHASGTTGPCGDS